jgi:hypothetical protein
MCIQHYGKNITETINTAAIMTEKPGIPLARGTSRLLSGLGYQSIPEFSLETGRRVDVFGIGKAGALVAVEVKSSREDFLSDTKWPNYLDYCDQFYFAVPEDFPEELLPDDHGLMRVDAYGGALIREAPLVPVKAARRKALLTRFARTAAARLRRLTDPEAALT